MNEKQPVKVALIGAGARGELNLATLAKRYPELIKFVAVAEPHEGRREQFIRNFGIKRGAAFADWREFAAAPQMADAVINALPCRMHYESAMAIMEHGYHMLLEKPMALRPEECAALVYSARDKGLILSVSLQCRYNRIYSRVRQLLDQGLTGRLMSIDCAENIGYWHFVLSYVRGIHHHSSMSHSFIMAKAVHDLDLILWFAGSRPKRVSSFGSLRFFNEENAPEGAPERCTEGCPVEETCVFSAVKQFIKPGKPAIPPILFLGQSMEAVIDVIMQPRFRTMASIVSQDDLSEEAVRKTLDESNYGRCVFRCPNNVVDHQSANIEFEDGITASFSLNAFSLVWERLLDLHGAKGEIMSRDFSGKLETRTYHPAKVRKERIPYHGIIHGGGDVALLVEFAKTVKSGDPKRMLTRAENVLESHLVGFAIEKAREENIVVDMDEFREEAFKGAKELSQR